MFKLRKAKTEAAEVAPKAGKPVKKRRASGAGKPMAKPKPKAKAAARVAKKAVGKSATAKKGAPKKGAKARNLPVLRKRVLEPRVDLGIGAVNVAPAKDAPRSSGLIAAEAAIDKKGTDVLLLDVRAVSGVCDEMLLATARSVTHLNAVSDAVEEALRKAGERVIHRDGLRGAEPDWILLDYGDLMIHLFRAEARENYRLEDYYAEARLIARWKND